MSTDPVLEFRAVAKAFGDGGEPIVLFSGLDWALEAGSAAAVVGESGCGKSTLLHLAATLERADAGSVWLSGRDTSRLSETALAPLRTTSLGLVFQFHYLLREFTVLENIALPSWLAGTPRRASWDRARDLAAQVGLERRLGSFPHQLSGGERQRVALARALVNDPPLILADEPTGNLDPRHAAEVADLLLDLVARQGKSLLLVTHDLAFARRTGRVLRLTGGHLVPE